MTKLKKNPPLRFGEKTHFVLNKKPCGWDGNVRGIQNLYVTNRAVLRRPSVRTRTSTTPVWMGSGGNGGVGGEEILEQRA